MMMKHPKTYRWAKPRRLIYCLWGSSARRLLCACPRKDFETNITVADNFAHMGDATAGPIFINFGTLCDLHDINNFASFGVNRFKGFYCVKDRKWPFPVLTQYYL
jgi:hypothetical protein